MIDETDCARESILKYAGNDFSFSDYIKYWGPKEKSEIEEAINRFHEIKFNNPYKIDDMYALNDALIIMNDFITRVRLIIAISDFIDACKPGCSIDARGSYSLLSLVKTHLDGPFRDYFASLSYDIDDVNAEVNDSVSEIICSNFSFSEFVGGGIKEHYSHGRCMAEHIVEEAIYSIMKFLDNDIEPYSAGCSNLIRRKLSTSINILDGLIGLISCIKNTRSAHKTDEEFNRVKRAVNHECFCELCWRPLGSSIIEVLSYGDFENKNIINVYSHLKDVFAWIHNKIANEKLYAAFDAFTAALLEHVVHKLSLPLFVELIRQYLDEPIKKFFLSLDINSLEADVEFVLHDIPFSERLSVGMWSHSDVDGHILDALFVLLDRDVSVKLKAPSKKKEYNELLELRIVLESLQSVVTIPDLYPEIFNDIKVDVNRNGRFCNKHLRPLPGNKYNVDIKYKAIFEEEIARLVHLKKEDRLDLSYESIRKMAFRSCRPSNKSNAKIIRKYSKIGFTPKQLTEKFGFSKQSISKALKRRELSECY